ncbi:MULTISPECIES: ABC transporter ATP-binding protein [unclassified Rhizobium]|jgi:peptide/nickel transport system ATP-binding protein|uniref:ABC transporter ATP-binding protein n=1 Tax=unclassified Rhizobium TaxID=2613769 RepID=UPI000DE06BE0|nr:MULTISPECIES: ABC transporter ATP-binding protein [unclassified Rhizobium]MBB3286913.1 peptide/nickel transport system ATP-binding protein [Rhizobium sp. BK252]MBB3401653.1 peptide/nickel transport system ATP-binding protein [Rhizobium sp. BK289]MBB3414403.1 peptide/nickel transport system ATP-binding protein [Rhizobium sp. BK284]MBB3482291.1 peptide/nickel transport system ATP-binding protein [Rhizobium sp. BK347]MDK4718408.1 ABC transporter ATP-binding protein [Rhizobium sp. CNPSo 3968]
MTPLIEARNLVRIYGMRSGLFGRPSSVRAVDGVSLAVAPGETLGIVGESGSGKSTLGRMLLGIDDAQEGAIHFEGRPMPERGSAEWRRLRAKMQLVFQDPLAALDRRLTIAAQIAEPLEIHKLIPKEHHAMRVAELMAAVGLRGDQAERYPHELSGGQRQRAVIARALASRPRLLVCDEPVSALDVSIQAQVINMMRDLQEQNGIAMVFISHDLKVVRNVADRVAVMYLGRIMEEASSDVIFHSPQHPYTRALVSSIPVPGKPLRDRVILQGEPPNPASRPSGCAFHPRCPLARDICRSTAPELREIGDGRTAACHVVTGETTPVAA